MHETRWPHLRSCPTGPAAARRWLAELQPAQLWRYQFLHCAELAGSPQEQWLLQALGAPPSVAVTCECMQKLRLGPSVCPSIYPGLPWPTREQVMRAVR